MAIEFQKLQASTQVLNLGKGLSKVTMDTRDPSYSKEMLELEMIMFGLKCNWNQYSPWVFLC